MLRQADLVRVLDPYRSAFWEDYRPWLAAEKVDEADIVPASAYLDPDSLREALDQEARELGTDSLRVVVSSWGQGYFGAFVPSVLTAMTIAGVGLDASPQNIGFLFEEGYPKWVVFKRLDDAAVYRPRLGCLDLDVSGCRAVSTVEELHQAVLPRLIQGHVEPVVLALREISRAPIRQLWGDVAAVGSYMYERMAGASLPGIADTIEQDRVALFETPPDTASLESNPLYDAVYFEYTDDPRVPLGRFAVRRSCCWFYKVPNDGHYCLGCPLITTGDRIHHLLDE